MIDTGTIKKYSTESYHAALDKFVSNPTLENAQKAQSDLGKLIRKLEQEGTLTSEKKATYDAAQKAKENIKENMFKDKSGKIDETLKYKYDKLTKSYGENVIPYTTNKAIQDYKRKDITKKELIQKLSKGKFAAKKGKEHPEIARRALVKQLLKTAGYAGGLGVIGGAIGAGSSIMNKLLNKKEGEQ